MLKVAPWTTTRTTRVKVTRSCGYDPYGHFFVCTRNPKGTVWDPTFSSSWGWYLIKVSDVCVRAAYGCVRILPLPRQISSNDTTQVPLTITRQSREPHLLQANEHLKVPYVKVLSGFKRKSPSGKALEQR
eukprot:2116400-Amphidinium_carterae.1